MATSDPAPGDEARQPPAPPDPEVLAELEREWEQVMKIAATGDTDERVRAFSTFAEKAACPRGPPAARPLRDHHPRGPRQRPRPPLAARLRRRLTD